MFNSIYARFDFYLVPLKVLLQHLTKLNNFSLIPLKVPLQHLTRLEMQHVLTSKFPHLVNIVQRLVSVYLTLSPNSQQHLMTVVDPTLSAATAAITATVSVSTVAASGRIVSFRDLVKWAGRINCHKKLIGEQLASYAFQVKNKLIIYGSYS